MCYYIEDEVCSINLQAKQFTIEKLLWKKYEDVHSEDEDVHCKDEDEDVHYEDEDEDVHYEDEDNQ